MAAIGRALFGVCRFRGILDASRHCFPKHTRSINVTRFAYSSQVEASKSSSLTDSTKDPEYAKAVERFKDVSNPDENWYFHGYNPHDREDDAFTHHNVMFLIITVSFIGGSFLMAYQPDKDLIHWRQREAYIELARREANGLPLVNPNLVAPEKLMSYLPTDEELGDTEVII